MTVTPKEQLSRSALLYLFAAFSGCVLLLSFFLPWWLLPVAGTCLLWRFLIFYGRLSFPAGWMKTALVLLCGFALLAQYGFSVSLDVFVMLLLSGFSLKLLEIYHVNDAQMLLYLCFFVLMTVFLFEQMPLYALLVFLVVVLVLAAMVAVQESGSALEDSALQDSVLKESLSKKSVLQGGISGHFFHPLRKAGLVFVMALPVMLFMFLVMPRLPPLWSMPLQKQQHGKTGMSDSMSPGDLVALTKSSNLAFRASFPEGIPERQALYWYGMIFDSFDGKTWKESCRECRDEWSRTTLQRHTPRQATLSPVVSPQVIPYQVIMEAHGNTWMYVLNPSDINDASVMSNRDNLFRYIHPVDQRTVYDAYYSKEKNDAVQVLPFREKYLALPDGNPQARALANAWAADGSGPDAIIRKALGNYRQSFFYTLEPPALGEQRVDDFLFVTRSGFCEHFASSFVFLMRAAGVPARVVVGYMGGETNQQDRYVVVRQYDAHAWAEIWLDGEGWVRVDPTSAVAPERIDLGFFDAFSRDEHFSVDGGLAAFRHIPLLNALRLQLDRVDYLWARWVLGYEGDKQQDLLKKLGLVSPLRIAVWGGVGVVTLFVLLCIYLYWREWHAAHELPATRRYRQLCRAYSYLGVERFIAETPLQYAERVSAANLYGAQAFLLLSQQYYEGLYRDSSMQNASTLPHFVKDTRRFFWSLWWHVVRSRQYRRQ